MTQFGRDLDLSHKSYLHVILVTLIMVPFLIFCYLLFHGNFEDDVDESIEENDEDFNFMAFEEEDDHEEFRTDKGVKISREFFMLPCCICNGKKAG